MGDHHRPDYTGVGLLLGADAAAIALFVPLHVDGTQVFIFAVALVVVNALAALIHRRAAGSPLFGRWSGLGAAIRVVGGSPQSARWAVVASVICVLGAGAADIGASSSPAPTLTRTKTPVASPTTPSSATPSPSTPSPSTPSPSTPSPSVKVYDPTTGPASLSIGVERAYLTNRLWITITGITWTRLAVSATIKIRTEGDHVCVYPLFRSLDLEGLSRVGSDPPRPVRFALDVHLRKLASLLRLAGFDAVLLTDDAEVAEVSATEERVALTRDVGLLKRSIIRHGYWVRHTDPELQLVEVLDRFNLAGQMHPFVRCMECNTLLTAVDADAIAERLPAGTRECCTQFHLCPGCGRIYWQGSHYDRLLRLLERARERAASPANTIDSKPRTL